MLLDVYHGEKEMLCEYMACSSIAMQGVDDLQDLIVFMALHIRLKGSQYATSLARPLNKLLAGAMTRAQKVMQVEDMLARKT